MKKIEAILRPGKLDEVMNALSEYGINGITISNVLGAGNQQGYTQIFRGQKVVTKLLPKIKMEIVTHDYKVEQIVDIITKYSKTGEVGDGKIFVSAIEQAVRIRTGETGESAL